MPITYPSSVVPVDPLPYHIGSTDQRRIDSTQAVVDAFRANSTQLKTNPLMADPNAVTYKDFAAAHSEHAHEWLETAKNGVHTFSDVGLTFVASTTLKRVYSVEGLQIGTISAMPRADQERIAGTAAFNQPGGVGERLGYLPDPTHTTVAGARNYLLGLVNAFETNEVDNATSTDGTGVQLPNDVKTLFKDQLQNIRDRLNASAIFNAEAVANALSDLKTRLSRIREFYVDAGPYLNAQPVTQPSDRVLDIPSIVETYRSLVDAERRIRNADNRLAQLTRLAAEGVPTLDLPTLIIRFQTLYEDMAKARGEADTAEVQALNALLRDYGEMQRMVNEVSGSIDPNEPKDRAAFAVTGDERVKNMFGRINGDERHPLERLGGITRPVLEITTISFTGWRHPYFKGTSIDGIFYDRTSEEAAHEATARYLGDLGMNILPPAFRPGGMLHFGAQNGISFSDWAHDIQTTAKNNKDNEDYRRRLSEQLGLKFILSSGDMNAIHEHYNAQANFQVLTRGSQAKGLYPNSELQSMQIAQVWIDLVFDKNWHENDKSDFMPVNYETYFDDFDLKGDFWNELDYNDDGDAGDAVYHVPQLFKSQWDGFNTRLSDTVTLLNQDNQIRQNRISQEESQANRHFELVSNTLRRMFDLLQTIGRSTA